MICAIPQGSTAASITDEVSFWHFALSSALKFLPNILQVYVCCRTRSQKLDNHLGPSIHQVHFESSTGFNPLEEISAGLSFPLQCRQLLAVTRLLISLTQFWTNCFHSFFSPLIQSNVTLESAQQVISVIANSSCKASLTCSISLANTRVARSSNLGMDNFFSGATLDLDATNLT